MMMRSLSAEGALGSGTSDYQLDVLASGSQFKILDNDLGHVELTCSPLSGEVNVGLEGNVETALADWKLAGCWKN